jgi:uncharacterized membrane protein
VSWLLIAFAAPLLWAISTHLDKYLVDRYFQSGDVGPLLVFTAVIDLPFLACIWIYDPSVFALPVESIWLITLTGILYMAAMYFYLEALQSEEATVVAPFFQLGPVFAFVLAYLVLHEMPGARQLAGGALVLLGSAVLSVEFGTHRRPRLRLLALMLVCALALAASSVIFKLFALRSEFWSTTFWTYVGQVIFGLGVLSIPRLRRSFWQMVRSNTKAVLGVNGANELINLSGSVIARYALLLAPVVLVQAIVSTTTLFVFLIGIALALAFPGAGRELISKAALAQKVTAIVLVCIGVALVGSS